MKKEDRIKIIETQNLKSAPIAIFDIVVARKIISNSVPKCAFGTVVHVYDDWKSYEVEFIVNGLSVVETVSIDQIKKI